MKQCPFIVEAKNLPVKAGPPEKINNSAREICGVHEKTPYISIG
jgi:hypothetical protein